MKKVKALLVAAVLSLPAVALAEGKIAVLNVQEAIINTAKAQKAIEALRATAEYKDNKKEFDAIKKEGMNLVEQYRKDSATMSTTQQDEMQRKIQDRRQDLEHVGRKLQDAEKKTMQSIMGEIGPVVKEVVDGMIKSEGIGLLIDQQAVMHVDSSYSITAKVTEKLNQKLK